MILLKFQLEMGLLDLHCLRISSSQHQISINFLQSDAEVDAYNPLVVVDVVFLVVFPNVLNYRNLHENKDTHTPIEQDQMKERTFQHSHDRKHSVWIA